MFRLDPLLDLLCLHLQRRPLNPSLNPALVRGGLFRGFFDLVDVVDIARQSGKIMRQLRNRLLELGEFAETIRRGLLGRLTSFLDRFLLVLQSLEAGCMTLHAFVDGFADRFVNALDGGADSRGDGSSYGQLKVLVDGTASALAAAVCQSTVKLCCSH